MLFSACLSAIHELVLLFCASLRIRFRISMSVGRCTLSKWSTLYESPTLPSCHAEFHGLCCNMFRFCIRRLSRHGDTGDASLVRLAQAFLPAVRNECSTVLWTLLVYDCDVVCFTVRLLLDTVALRSLPRLRALAERSKGTKVPSAICYFSHSYVFWVHSTARPRRARVCRVGQSARLGPAGGSHDISSQSAVKTS